MRKANTNQGSFPKIHIGSLNLGAIMEYLILVSNIFLQNRFRNDYRNTSKGYI